MYTSIHSIVLCVIAPQLSHAPFLYFFALPLDCCGVAKKKGEWTMAAQFSFASRIVTSTHGAGGQAVVAVIRAGIRMNTRVRAHCKA